MDARTHANIQPLAVDRGIAAPAHRRILNQGRKFQSFVSENESAFDTVLQFTNIARPGMLLQRPTREYRELLLRTALRIEVCQKAFGEQVDVAAAAAQRRQIDRKNGEPIQQVLAQLP